MEKLTFACAKDALQYVKEHEVVNIDLKVCDLFGRWRHLTIPASTLTEEKLTEGFGFDGSSYGFKKVNDSDMIMIPDLSRAFVDPFWEQPTLSFFCRIHTTEENEPRFSQDPRYILQKAEAYLKSLGVGDTLLLGPEYEFYVFDKVSFYDETHKAGYAIDSLQAPWNVSPEGNGGYPMPIKSGYHGCLPEDRFASFRSDLVTLLESMGIETKYHHHEVGGPGQMEIETTFGTPLEMADNTMLIKYSVKNFALQNGVTATFMPKPMFGIPGNGFHVHFKWLKNGKNIFADTQGYGGYAGLSETAIHFMTGILVHARAISAFANPSTNSYKRLVPGYEAPVSVVFAKSNRSAAIRIPGYVKAEDDRRFEYRAGDATANPYLMFAAMIMAGADGVRRKLNPRDYNVGPYEGNLYELPESERKNIKALPTNLEEALQALQADKEFLLADGVFTPELIDTWCKRKYAEECEVIARRPHPMEFFLSYNC